MTRIDELPSALGEDLLAELGDRRPALFLDFDGTLCPIVPHPDQAVLDNETRQALRRIADRYPVAVVSGRDRLDVAGRVALDDLYYAGSHGCDISGPGGFSQQWGAELRPSLHDAGDELDQALEGIPGAWVERKRFALAVHYRQAPADAEARIEQAVRSVAARHPDLRVAGGKKIFELRPDIDWDKGKAVMWLLESMGLRTDGIVPIYLGDDETDEDVFRRFEDGSGIGIVVGAGDRLTAARYRLADPAEVSAFLLRLAKVPRYST
ncbi:MAG: trehalose-phosphatase [Acidimicrobiia bacterium]